jgi:molybdate transport system substrate-binding protein
MKHIYLLFIKMSYKTLILVSSLSLSLTLLLATGCTPDDDGSRLSVFAAAGAKPAIDEACESFQQQSGYDIEVNYGGGGEILSNMILARSGDIYIAPEQRFMTAATEKGAVYPETIHSLAYMIPVIAVQKGNPESIYGLDDLVRPGLRVAITRPETTLLGKYAPDIFQKAGLAESIEPNIVTYAASPSSLLNMLVIGQIDAGILWHFYQTLAPEKIDVIYLEPEQLTGVAEMQVAISTYSKNKEVSERFIEFVSSSEGKSIFKKYGYIVDSEEIKKYWH